MSFKDLKRDYIIDTAKKLFLAKSIGEITIKDISAVSGIGEATIYRYFTNKENLVTAVSLSLQQDILKIQFEDTDSSGLENIQNFFNLFRNIFVEHKEYVKFIAEFDIVYLNTIENKENKQYSLSLDVFYDLFIRFYNQGLEDNSVKEVKDIKLYYYTSTHSLLELCKKLASSNTGLKQDKAVDRVKEIEYLISLFISVLKA